MIVIGAALIDLILQPLYPGWIWVMPFALLYLIIFKSRNHLAIMLGALWCDLWSGYPFGVVSAIIIMLWFLAGVASRYVRIPN